MTAPVTFAGYQIGIVTGLKGLVAAIAGGWTLRGTVMAALAIGLLEAFWSGFVSAGLRDVFALTFLICFLVVRSGPSTGAEGRAL